MLRVTLTRRRVLARIFLTPLEQFLPRWLRIVIAVMIAIFPATTYLVCSRFSYQSTYNIDLSFYGSAVKQALQKEDSLEDISINTVPRPSFWSDQAPYLVVTGETATKENYARLASILVDPCQTYSDQPSDEMLAVMRQLAQRSEYKVVVDATIRETGARKQETLVIPKAESAAEDEE